MELESKKCFLPLIDVIMEHTLTLSAESGNHLTPLTCIKTKSDLIDGAPRQLIRRSHRRKMNEILHLIIFFSKVYFIRTRNQQRHHLSPFLACPKIQAK